MENYNELQFLNIGCGYEVGMKQLFTLISNTVDYRGDLIFDSSKPDGTISKLIDNTKIKELGWSPKINLKEGLQNTYNWYLNVNKNF